MYKVLKRTPTNLSYYSMKDKKSKNMHYIFSAMPCLDGTSLKMMWKS